MRHFKIIFLLILLASCTKEEKTQNDNGTNVKLLWRKPNYEWITSSIFIKNKTIYFGSFNDNFYTADLTTGKEKFKFKTGYDPYYLPIINDKKIYFSSFDLNIYCIDTLGKLVWKIPTNERIKNNLVEEDNLLYVSIRSEGLKAFNKENGSLLWHLTQDSQSFSTSQPIIYKENVYLGNWDLDNSLIAVNKKTGKIIWRKKYPDFASSNPTLSSKGIIVCFNKYYKGGNVKMLDYDTGKEIWTTPLLCEASVKAYTDDKNAVISTYDGKVVCLNNLNGKIKWSIQLEKDEVADSEFCFFKQHLYFGTSNRNLYCINLNTGKITFKEPFNYGISNPIVSENKIYFPTGGNELWTLNN